MLSNYWFSQVSMKLNLLVSLNCAIAIIIKVTRLCSHLCLRILSCTQFMALATCLPSAFNTDLYSQYTAIYSFSCPNPASLISLSTFCSQGFNHYELLAIPYIQDFLMLFHKLFLVIGPPHFLC